MLRKISYCYGFKKLASAFQMNNSVCTNESILLENDHMTVNILKEVLLLNNLQITASPAVTLRSE